MRLVVTFRSAPHSDGIRSLRRLLKAAKRQFDLIAIDALEIADQHQGISAVAEKAPSETLISPTSHSNR